MASTNKTTNYELSQYIGSDKPTYLGDYNGDMLKIDTAIHTNAVAVATAQSTAETASTTANTALTNAGTAQTTAETASTTATSALSKANTNETKITALENGNNYSLSEEIDTGKKWINGETIYRKVIQYTPSSIIGASNTTTYVSVAHNISNIGLVTDIHTSRYQGSGVTGFVPNFAGSSSLTGGLSYNVVNTTNIVFKIINDTYSVGSTFYITLEYIKEV